MNAVSIKKYLINDGVVDKLIGIKPAGNIIFQKIFLILLDFYLYLAFTLVCLFFRVASGCALHYSKPILSNILASFYK